MARITVILACVLAGCCPLKERTRPVIIEKDRIVVELVRDELLQEQEVVSGPLAQCPAVAAARKAALETCNGQLRAIKEGRKNE
jgi:hypothetical protein